MLALLVASDEAAYRVDAEEHRRVEHPAHEVVLLPRIAGSWCSMLSK